MQTVSCPVGLGRNTSHDFTPAELVVAISIADVGGNHNAPNRKWAIDLNFLDYRKLPPATHAVRKARPRTMSAVAVK